jgi:predicted nucleic acid-binding protein
LVYLDSSALLKRVLDEPNSAALKDRVEELENGEHELLTSTLAWIEVTRALKTRAERLSVDSPVDFDAQALAGITGFPISYEIVSLARRIGPRSLRSLDSIHCATATLVDASVLLTYDQRLAKAAAEIGLLVESPGSEK